MRFSDPRSNETTRDALSVLHLTPCQSQGVRDTLLQEASAREGSESWDLRQRSASISVECMQGRRIRKGIMVKTSRRSSLCVARRGLFFACVLDEHLVPGSVFIYRWQSCLDVLKMSESNGLEKGHVVSRML